MLDSKITRLLGRLREGDARAGEELAPLVYAQLHTIAERAMTPGRPDHTLQPTALVNEAWIRVFRGGRTFEGRTHFLSIAAKAMRSVLVDHARRRGAQKRTEGRKRLPLENVVLSFEERAIDLVNLEEALEELAAMDPPLAELVELHFYGGLTHEEVARLQGRSLRTIERSWRTARAWLLKRLEGSRP